jgi:hypothetical protein
MGITKAVLFLAIAGVGSGGIGCATPEPQVSSVGPTTPRPVPPGIIHGSFVQAGTIFPVKLDQPIDTYYTQPGTAFTATVVRTLYDRNGNVIVPYGSKLSGILASVGPRENPRIRVDVRYVMTVAGLSPLHAAVQHAQHVDWNGPPEWVPYDSYLYAYDFLDYGSEASIPGSPAAGATMMQPREIDVPAGAIVQLQLVEPLVLPGAQLGPRQPAAPPTQAP